MRAMLSAWRGLAEAEAAARGLTLRELARESVFALACLWVLAIDTVLLIVMAGRP